MSLFRHTTSQIYTSADAEYFPIFLLRILLSLISVVVFCDEHLSVVPTVGTNVLTSQSRLLRRGDVPRRRRAQRGDCDGHLQILQLALQ